MYERADSLYLGPWHKGVFYNLPPELVPKDGLSEGENFYLGPAGDIEKRPGYASYKSLATLGASTVLTMVAEFEPTAGTTYVVICAGAKIYYYSTSWTDITGAAVITAGADYTFEWENANGTLIACNGQDDEPIKWTGTGNAAALDVDSRFDKAKHVAWWDNRAWFGNVNGIPGRVWYSDPGDIETYGATAFYNVGAAITGLAELDDMLTIHTKDAIWTLTPTQNSQIPYELKQTRVRGSLSGRSIAVLPGRRLLYPLEDGFYEWTGGEDSIKKISYQLDDAYWPYVNTARLPYGFCVYYPRKNAVWFSVPYGASQTTQNQLMVYQEYRAPDGEEGARWMGPWKATGTAATGFDRNCGTLVDNKPHLGSRTGFLYDHDSGTNDVSTAISTYVVTVGPGPDEASPEQVYRWLFARIGFTGTGDYNVTVTQLGEDISGATGTINVQGAGFTLDVSLLDQGTLSNKSIVYQDFPLNDYGSNTYLQFSNGSASQTFKIWHALIHHRNIGRKRRRNVRV